MLVTSSGQDWKAVQTCSLVDLTVQSSTGDDIWWLATEAHMVGERAVCILLECILVGMADSGINKNKKISYAG